MGDELPLGAEVDWTPAKPPSRAPLLGSHVLLRPVDAVADAEALYAVSHPPEGDPAIWTYLPYGPYEHPDQMRVLLDWAEKSDDPLFFALVGLADERPAGLASYRITPEFGVIEIGHICSGRRCGAPPRRPRPSTCSPATRSTTSATAGSSGSATR